MTYEMRLSKNSNLFFGISATLCLTNNRYNELFLGSLQEFAVARVRYSFVNISSILGVHGVKFFDSPCDLAHFLVLTPYISNLVPHF